MITTTGERKVIDTLMENNARISLEYLANFEPTREQVDEAAMWRSHDFGVLDEHEKSKARFEARQWLLAWQKALTR